MGAGDRDKSVKQHPVVVVVLLLVVGGVLALFPIALYANAVAMIDGYRASNGQTGAAGVATVESAVEGRGGQVCKGTFATDDGGVVADIRIDVPGDCEEGQQIEARFMEARPSMFIGYDEPRAWAAGAGDWGVYIPLVVLFGLLSLPLVLVIYMVMAKLVKAVFLPPDVPEV